MLESTQVWICSSNLGLNFDFRNLGFPTVFDFDFTILGAKLKLLFLFSQSSKKKSAVGFEGFLSNQVKKWKFKLIWLFLLVNLNINLFQQEHDVQNDFPGVQSFNVYKRKI